MNRLHPINRAAFGPSQESFTSAIDEQPQAQLRLAEVILDQCLYHTMAVAYQNSHLSLGQDPIGDIRHKIEEFKFERAEPIYREFVDGFKVPRID